VIRTIKRLLILAGIGAVAQKVMGTRSPGSGAAGSGAAGSGAGGSAQWPPITTPGNDPS
jgi:hypothetical protein